MKFVDYLALGEIVEAVKDNKNAITTIMTNPVGAAAVTAITIGTMATVAWYKHEENKDKRKYRNENN